MKKNERELFFQFEKIYRSQYGIEKLSQRQRKELCSALPGDRTIMGIAFYDILANHHYLCKFELNGYIQILSEFAAGGREKGAEEVAGKQLEVAARLGCERGEQEERAD